ncbi:NACHT domain-containing protein [Streptomyces sp. NPDC001286]
MTQKPAKEPSAGSGRGALAAALGQLWADSGLDKGVVVARANHLLDDWGVRRVSASRFTERLSGQPGSSFAQLWALVAVMLVARGDLTPADAAVPLRGTAADDGPPAPRARAGQASGQSSAPRVRAGRTSGAGRSRAQARYEYWYELWKSVNDELGPNTGRRLGIYLEAAARAHRGHAYPDLFNDDSSLITDTYVPQLAAATAPGQEGDGKPGPAAEVFAAVSGSSLLVAGPGGGKSTLMRIQATEKAAQLAERRSGKDVPVLVRAAKLTARGPFPHVLAAAACDALADHLAPGTLLADFFRHRPTPKAKWLVLVDGLDEIPARARTTLLRTLATAEQEGHYRFIVSTRPLPRDELDATPPAWSRFDLLPFTAEDLHEYARARFADLTDPDGHVERFTALLAESGLADLARTPLMAALLCRLYIQTPGQRLPNGRTAVYREFVDRIYNQNTHKDVIESHQRAIETLARPFQHVPDRDTVTSAASTARNELPDLVGHLAFQQLYARAGTFADALADHPLSCPPKPLSAREWHAFLREMLQVTGLLTAHGRELAFPHRTFMEYHAARYATRTRLERAWELRHLLDSRWVRPPTWPFTRKTWSMSVIKVNLLSFLGFNGLPTLTHADMSYAGFVLDLIDAHGGPGADVRIRYQRIAAKGGAEGATFVTLQAALGTLVPAQAAHAAQATLARVALSRRRVSGEQRLLAAETLCRVGDERGLEALRAMAENPQQLDVIDQWHTPFRLQAMPYIFAPITPYEAEIMRRHSRSDTNAKLEQVMRDPTLPETAREEAARVRAAFAAVIGENASEGVDQSKSERNRRRWGTKRDRPGHEGDETER